MMSHPLDGAIIRVWRAEQHVSDLGRRIDEIATAHANAALDRLDLDDLQPSHEFVHEGRLLGGAFPFQIETIQTPPILPAIIGEILYNLRSALDDLVYELARLDSGKDQDDTQFVIVSKEEDFWKQQGRRLTGLYRCHVSAIERLQPYNGVQWTEILRNLSNSDKHRQLTVTLSHTLGFLKFFTSPPVGRSGYIEEPIRRARVQDREVYVQYPFMLSVVFPDGSGVVNSLRVLQSEVAATIEFFKPEFGHQDRS